jgi:tRNA 2-selenouridine synthase
MMDLDQFPSIDSLPPLLLHDIPLIDVRAPTEFTQGALPQSTNLPLMDDQDRIEIGTCYKQSGQEAAIQLGQQRVSGEVKAQRVAAWTDFIEQHPNAVLYCFRGGLRSKITQQWIYAATGKIIPRVEGGYKALRRLLLDSIDSSMQKITPLVLSGRTGSGKTRLLYELNDMIDLEGLANHRGSAFGRCVTPQPSPINFENNLAIHLLKQLDKGRTTLVFEDESRNIGSLHLPPVFFDHLKAANIIVLKIDDVERIRITLQEYVTDMEAAWQKDGNGFADFAEYWSSSLARIKKRLGGQKYQELDAHLQKTLQIHAKTGDKQGYEKLIKHLLHDYYDAMYDYQLSRKQDRVIFSGDKNSVMDYLKQQGIT